ncbi:MAG: hypothetical protein ACJAZ3_000247 [Sphingobacteriales bacterium]
MNLLNSEKGSDNNAFHYDKAKKNIRITVLLNRVIMKKLAILAIVTFISITAFAQRTTVDTIGATCDAAYVICDKNGLVVTDVQNGSNASLVANSPSCFGKPRKQSVYVKFTVSKTGTLEFIISPLDSARALVADQTASEYDYGLYNFTGCSGSGAEMNLADEICCNFNSNYRTANRYRTGITNAGGKICGGSTSHDPFSKSIAVTEGNEYVILIDRDYLDNPSGPGNSANGGFLLTFGGSFEIKNTGTACGDSTTSVQSTQVLNASVNLYPNPFNDGITLDVEAKKQLNFTYEIINLLGQTTFLSQETIIKSGLNSLKLDNSQFGEGQVFFVKLNLEDEIAIYKVIKQ